MSKFVGIDEFRAENGNYSLLPFRFESIDFENIVVTNSVGEFVIMGRDKLDPLVEKSLPSNDPDYVALRRIQVLKEPSDYWALSLLALKTRTRLLPLRNFTNLHIFVVSLRCDHSCQYCQVSRQSDNKLAYDMSEGTANKALDMVFRSPNEAIKIEFQGGEPLLNFELIRYVVEKAEERNQIEQRDLQFVIATSLSLATNDILEYCRDHHIYLSSSLDGPADLHNKNRPRPGRDSHERFSDGLRRARDIVGYDAVSALMTTSPASMTRVTDIIDEYLRFGFDSIFLRHLSPYGFAVKTKSYQAYNAERWLQFYKEGVEYILDLNRKGIRFVEHYSTIILTKMFAVNDPGFVDLKNPAGVGIAAVVFNYDGDVYASDESRMLHEMGDSSFRMGNLHENTYKEIFTSDALLSALEDSFTLSAPMCSDCAFESWCGADPVFHHATFGDMLGRKPESEFCKRTMGIIRYLLDKIRNDTEALEIFKRWVNKC
ncbi:His-Xaa-Ser system radical SAM maturase HxsB [Acidihalobacter prosperus]|uniref:His-Xaa-Ser system radical SAM maturase HxsB n=1 Tax=Acidihalobacter prosperus TaxID=160660 RepID=A0A1A6C726_9GAMM|nr:His-Xaa-Ser system radical SAM maturase HxsB [Acidihalobacter prosperus]OBS10366.1 His-Xaa-Ser system radical SAM maturase HxsB [Acidihalobacter prosperus]